MNPRLDPRRWLHYLLAPLDGPLTLLILILARILGVAGINGRDGRGEERAGHGRYLLAVQ